MEGLRRSYSVVKELKGVKELRRMSCFHSFCHVF